MRGTQKRKYLASSQQNDFGHLKQDEIPIKFLLTSMRKKGSKNFTNSKYFQNVNPVTFFNFNLVQYRPKKELDRPYLDNDGIFFF